MKHYYKTKNDVMTSSLEDKIDTLLYINAKSCEQSLKNIIRSKDKTIDDIKERNIKIGALVMGVCKKICVNSIYPCIEVSILLTSFVIYIISYINLISKTFFSFCYIF